MTGAERPLVTNMSHKLDQSAVELWIDLLTQTQRGPVSSRKHPEHHRL